MLTDTTLGELARRYASLVSEAVALRKRMVEVEDEARVVKGQMRQILMSEDDEAPIEPVAASEFTPETGRREAALRFLEVKGEAGIEDLALHVYGVADDRAKANVRGMLRDLTRQGRVERVGLGRYSLPSNKVPASGKPAITWRERFQEMALQLGPSPSTLESDPSHSGFSDEEMVDLEQRLDDLNNAAKPKEGS